MFDPQALLLFVAAGLVLNFTPGPDLLYITARSLGQGWRAGAASSLGIAAGCGVHTAAAALGISALLAASPLAYDAIRLCGAAYLIWLGAQALRTRAAPGAIAELPPAPLRAVFWQGFATNVLNPKVALFFLAFLPQFVDPAGGQVALKLVVLGLVFNVCGTLVNLGVGVLAGQAGAFFARRAGWWRWQNRIVAGLLTALAARIALGGQRA
jgi:threonine/homoserine/homoserine lactone efflux protein